MWTGDKVSVDPQIDHSTLRESEKSRDYPNRSRMGVMGAIDGDDGCPFPWRIFFLTFDFFFQSYSLLKHTL